MEKLMQNKVGNLKKIVGQDREYWVLDEDVRQDFRICRDIPRLGGIGCLDCKSFVRQPVVYITEKINHARESNPTVKPSFAIREHHSLGCAAVELGAVLREEQLRIMRQMRNGT